MAGEAQAAGVLGTLVGIGRRARGPGAASVPGALLGEPEHGAHPATPFQSGSQYKSCVFTVPGRTFLTGPNSGPFLKWALLNKAPQAPLSVSHTTGSLAF